VHIEPRVDPATGARDVRLALREAIADAPAGLTVTVNLIVEKRAQAVSIPRRSIVLENGAAQARIVGAYGVVQARAISFIDWPAERVIVTSGLKPGERILVDPSAARPGDKVQVAP
jgi:HlyD family secretion protein